MKQQNEYCGVVFKEDGSLGELPKGFKEIQTNCFAKSKYPVLFDGSLEEGNGAWSKAEFCQEKVVLSRDRVGGRFIYYYENERVFCFANTIKQMLDLSFVDFRVCQKAAFDFLFLGKVGDMIEGIHALKANTELEIDLVSFTKKESEREFPSKLLEIDEEDNASELVRKSIVEKVSFISRSTKNLGALLSGGIDSSVIASSLFIENRQSNLPFITAISEVEHLNELSFANAVVSKLGIKTWHQILAQKIDKEVENLHLAMELPTTSLGSFLQYEIMRFCQHQGIKEVLDGTGADALFAGHNYYHAVYWNELIRKGQLLKAVKLSIASGVAKNSFKYYWKNMIKYAYLPRLPIASKLRFHFRNNELLSALNPTFIEENYKQLEKMTKGSLRKVNPFLSNDFFGGGVEDLLRFNDRIGKYFGVMNRSVFTESPSIYETALSISSDLKFKDGYSKYILRKAFEDLLPVEVLNRKDKMGLVAPNNDWMKEHRNLFLSYITVELEEFFDVALMKEKLSEAILNSGEQENYKIFRFISFAIWFKVMSN